MRKHLIVAGVAAAAMIPSFASAQTQQQLGIAQQLFGQPSPQSCQSPVTAGANANVGAGSSTGAQVAGRLLGALLGRPADCARAYGYYDANGMWHANQVDRAQASGYFDRDGRWVEGAPNGYYDPQGRWVTAGTSASAGGYYDQSGRWVPASAGGYYDSNGQWVTAGASGRWENGRWIEGPANGRYDADGRWVPGQAAGRMVNGVWVADAQPGYYTDGRWVRGQAAGYYDAQGRWVSTGVSAQGSGYSQGYGQQGQQGQMGAYGGASIWTGAPQDLAGRVAFLDQRIRQGMGEGTLRRGGDEDASAETADPDAPRGPPAEDGARDGMPEVLEAPEVPVEEPWQGYRRMTVPEISDRFPAERDEALLTVRLYEVTHKNRRGVLEAVERELKRR